MVCISEINITGVTKSRWAGHVAYKGHLVNVYILMVRR